MGLVLVSFGENSIQLVPDGTLILHLIAIVGMVTVLNRTLFGPINRILEERSRRTEGLLEEARKTISAIEEKLAHYEHALRAARAEGYRRLESEKAEAVGERESQVAATREELGKLTGDNKGRITEQLEAARRTLALEAQRIGLEIGSRILGRPIRGQG